MNRYDFSPLFRHTVGFDRMQRLLDATLERAGDQSGGYPPYNIEAVGDDAYRISLAVAGFGEGDLSITAQDGSLVISGKVQKDEANGVYLHRGIAARAFERKFDLADHVKVAGASLANGMLYVDLEREVPEALKPRQIEIKKGQPVSLGDKAKKLIGKDEKKAA